LNATSQRVVGVRLVIEVLGLGHVEVDPQRPVVGQGRQQVALLHEAAEPHHEPIHQPGERGADLGEAHVGLGERQLGLGAVELGGAQRELGRRHDVLVGQHLGVLVFDRGHVGLRLGAAEVRPVDERHDLEHLRALLDELALVDEDLRQVAALLGAHLDVLDRLDLGDVLVGQLHVLAAAGS
jgi:hypothetical protein